MRVLALFLAFAASASADLTVPLAAVPELTSNCFKQQYETQGPMLQGTPSLQTEQELKYWKSAFERQVKAAVEETVQLRSELSESEFQSICQEEFLQARPVATAALAKEINELKTTWTAEVSERFLGSSVKDATYLMGTIMGDKAAKLEPLEDNVSYLGDIPESFDARTAFPECAGVIGHIRDQSECGSCWAFSATGSLEGAYCAAGHGPIDISEQQLVDCSKKQGNAGCRGGLMTQAFQYVMDNKGICAESDYPYKGAVARLPFFGNCKAKKCKNAMKIEGFSAVPKNNDDALTAAIALKGAIAVAIQADERAFQFYKSGVFSAPCGTNLNHGVLAVGYGSENGEDYYIVKNSWGSSWGDKGYIKFARGAHINGGQGQCGVNMWPVFPKVSKA
eukprot:GDKI01020190.1.p1 GENE.GDKI01020190.1~~GDKI01020190.1.p1  ORF type:complete len:414 (-),score=151.63 GDKI01020190.1:416-1597(-)